MKKRINRWLAGGVIIALLVTSGIATLADENTDMSIPIAGESYEEEGEHGGNDLGGDINLPPFCDGLEVGGCCNSTGDESDLNELDCDDIDIIEVERCEDLCLYEALEFLYVDEQTVHTPMEQHIALGFENEEMVITSAVLQLKSLNTKEERLLYASNLVDNLVLFSHYYEEGSAEDEFLIVSIEYTVEGQEEPLLVVFYNQEIEASYIVTNEPLFDSEESGITVYGFDEDGEIISEETTIEEMAETIGEILDAIDESVEISEPILEEEWEDLQEELLEDCSEQLQPFMGIAPTSGIAPRTEVAAFSNNRIIAVSAGHCSTHRGAYANGLHEYQLTWHVANVVRNELNRFAGITAILDRPTIHCRYHPGVWTAAASNHCLTQRIRDARAAGATVFVDIHFNAGPASAHGAEVWIPNNNINDGRHQEGVRLSNAILGNLATLGLANRGHRTRDNEQGRDWLATNRIARELGMTGILVEGGFLTNTADANRLRDPNFRHNLGVQIARGIASVYGATVPPAQDQPQQLTSTTTATNVNGQDRFFDLRVNFNTDRWVSRVQFEVWSEAGGQRNARWYNGSRQGNNSWVIRADVRNHQAAANHQAVGRYQVRTWVTLTNGTRFMTSSTNFNVRPMSGGNITIANTNIGAGTFEVIVRGVNSPSGINRVLIPVWTRADQGDIRWNTATRHSDGSFRLTINIAQHGFHVGRYHVHAHVFAENGSRRVLSIHHNVTGRPQISVTATNRNGTETLFDLRATNVGIHGTIQQVRFAVWGNVNGQNDLIWYNGTQSNGVWTATADVRRHREAGLYHVHVWATRSDGSMVLVGTTVFNVSPAPAGTIRVQNSNPTAGTFDVIVQGINTPSGINRVYIPVWSQPNQGDIVWYPAVRHSDGSFRATIRISNHNFNIGRYTIHAHIHTGNGLLRIIGTHHNVTTGPQASVTATNRGGTETYFDLRLNNANLHGNMRAVHFAVWGNVNGQNDLIWYPGTLNNGVWAATADIRRHREAGRYHVHVWGTRQDGSLVLIAHTAFHVTAPSVQSIRVVNYNPARGTFDVIIAGIRSPSGVNLVTVPTWSRPNQSDIVWYSTVRHNADSFRTTVNISNHNNNTGRYTIHAHITTGNGQLIIVGTHHTVTGQATAPGLISIMGPSQTNAAQMVRNFRNTGHTFPSGALGMSLESFAQLVLAEANREGVRAEVLWTQVMRETGWLQFRGDVRIHQFNFGGLGATGGGNPGHSFPSVQIGLRAQVHHLVAYATTAPVRHPSNRAHPVLRTAPPWGPTGQTRVNGTESPRFHFVARGISPYVNWLGQGENPNHPGFWAADRNYGAALATAIRVLLNS